MISSIEDVILLHQNKGKIEDAYVKIHIDEKILNLNIFTMKITNVESTKKDVDIWNERVITEIRKNRTLEKEINEFTSIFELLNKYRVKSGMIEKTECPDFVLTRNDKKIGIEITKIYVGYDWMLEKISNEIKLYKMENSDIEGYLEYRKAGDKLELYNRNGQVILTPKLFPKMNEEYEINIKNKIFEKIRKLMDDYKKYDINVIYADITSPEYFEDVTDLDKFTNEISYYITHLESNMSFAEYKLILKINNKWIEINLNDSSYRIL